MNQQIDHVQIRSLHCF